MQTEHMEGRIYPDFIGTDNNGEDCYGDLHVCLGDDGIILDLVDPDGNVMLTSGLDFETLAGLLK